MHIHIASAIEDNFLWSW